MRPVTLLAPMVFVFVTSTQTSCAVNSESDQAKLLKETRSPTDASQIDWVGSWKGVNAKGDPYKFELYEKGRAELEHRRGNSAGTWLVKDNRICTAWKEFRPSPRCDTVYRNNQRLYVFKPDGTYNGWIEEE